MCGLCGAFGAAADWAEAGAAGAAQRGFRSRAASRVLARYGLTLDSWGGRYILRSRTGKTALVDNLSRMWPVAEALVRRPLDPLDEGLLASLEKP